MDALPYPDFDDYFARHAASPLEEEIEALLFFETSRGCWWGEKHHCKFCGLNGSRLAYRSKYPRRAVDELVYLHRRHGATRPARPTTSSTTATSTPSCPCSARPGWTSSSSSR